MSALPVLNPYPETEMISTKTADGAYYVAREEAAQVIVVGPMHFTPGDYFQALNDLLDTHYDLCESMFMTTGIATEEVYQHVLKRGFVSLIGKRNGHA